LHPNPPASLSLSLSLSPPLHPWVPFLPPFLCVLLENLCHVICSKNKTLKKNPKKKKPLLWTHPPPQALWCFLISFLTNVCVSVCLPPRLDIFWDIFWFVECLAPTTTAPTPSHISYTYVSHLLYPHFFITITFVSFVLDLVSTLLCTTKERFSFLLCFHMIINNSSLIFLSMLNLVLININIMNMEKYMLICFFHIH
jgi:hypothetical protein